MKKNYSKKEMKDILRKDIKIPRYVNERIDRTYAELGIKSKVTMRYTKRHRVWVAVAASVAMLAGMSIVVVAATRFLSADLVEKEDKVGYQFRVDKEMEAHEIKVETTYMPEGYVYGEENSAYGGKWHNYDTGGGITVLQYNAAELDELERTNNADFMSYAKDDRMKSIEISGMKSDVFVSDSFYVDSEKTVNNLFLFNEEYGYGVQLSSNSNLSADELIKVAKGLKITVLDTVVPYTTEEEIENSKAKNDAWKKDEEDRLQAGVPADAVFDIGEEVSDPIYDPNVENAEDFMNNIRYTVEQVEIKDTLPIEEFPVENYIDYEGEVSAWVDEDGRLKPHDRYRNDWAKTEEEMELEKVQSKYVVVKMKARNAADTQSKWNKTDGIPITPDLTTLVPRQDGNYDYLPYSFYSANEGYQLQWESYNSSSFPVYFDKIYYTEGTKRLTHGLWRPLGAGEELEYTLVYVVDADQLDNLCLWFYSGNGTSRSENGDFDSRYVWISQE